jgi:hypothetical protein
MNIFAAISGWFAKQQRSLQKLFVRIEPLVAKAEPIVQQISSVVAEVAVVDPGLLPEAGLLEALNAYLTKTVGVTSVVDAFMKENETTPTNSLLHNAAVLALQYTHGQPSVEISDLDTAVQLAYSALKEQAPAVAVPAAPVAAK